jgi:hypothetical protein
MSTVRVVPANDGSWKVAGARTIPTGVRIERRAPPTESEAGSEARMAGNAVFGTPPPTRVRAGSPMAPPSAHVPSRAALRAVLHRLACPSCQTVGKLVLNGTHGTRRSARCTFQKAGGRICGRNWAGLPLATAVEVAWSDLQAEVSSEKEDEAGEAEPEDGSDIGKETDMAAPSIRPRALSLETDLMETPEAVTLAGQVTVLMATLGRSQEMQLKSQVMLGRAQEMQSELQGLLNAERERADKLAASLRGVEEKLKQHIQDTMSPGGEVAVRPPKEVQEARPSFADILKQQQSGANAQAQASASAQAQLQARARYPVQTLDLMRRELQKIGALPPARETPTWRMVTATYFQNLSRCPVGKLRAIIRSAVHHDAAIAASFIGRNVVEILCTRNWTTRLTAFLETMGAKALLDYQPTSEPAGPGRQARNTAGNNAACIARWKRELSSCPGRARSWYQASLDKVQEEGSEPQEAADSPEGSSIVEPEAVEADVPHGADEVACRNGDRGAETFGPTNEDGLMGPHIAEAESETARGSSSPTLDITTSGHPHIVSSPNTTGTADSSDDSENGPFDPDEALASALSSELDDPSNTAVGCQTNDTCDWADGCELVEAPPQVASRKSGPPTN